MAFFESTDDEFYLNAFANNDFSNKTHFVYVIPTAKMVGYHVVQQLALIWGLLSLALHLGYLLATVAMGGQLDEMTIAYFCVSSTGAVLLVALRNLFLNVEKVNLSGTKIHKTYSIALYLLLLSVFFNVSIGFGIYTFSLEQGLHLGFAVFFLLFTLLTFVTFNRLRWVINADKISVN